MKNNRPKLIEPHPIVKASTDLETFFSESERIASTYNISPEDAGKWILRFYNRGTITYIDATDSDLEPVMKRKGPLPEITAEDLIKSIKND